MLGLPTVIGLAALLSTHVQAYNIQAMLYDSNGRETKIDQTNPFLETPSIPSDDFGVTAAATRGPGDCPGNATCDSGNGTSRITPSGKNFKLYCSKQHGAGTIQVTRSRSFEDCVDACGARAGCFAVDWEKNGGVCCQLHAGYSPPSTNNVNLNAAVLLDCDVAKRLKCPADDKKIFTSAERRWRVNCIINSPAPTLRQVSAYSYEECADACDKDVSCVHVATWGPSGDCYLKSSALNPATDGTSRDNVIWLEPLVLFRSAFERFEILSRDSGGCG
ncbi:hypothetical protein ABVK25_000795 [Lepraria finkii]|uniref:Apple domain-containing protein n=1 Tax=Lepraria finkii TaxID=1340010 RepID=A0ABR4BNX2_9LECA